VAAGIIDVYLQKLTSLSKVAIEDDDPIAMGTASHLHDGWVVAVLALLARPFHQNLDLTTNQFLIVFLGNSVLYL
jgi:hypothetical protein